MSLLLFTFPLCRCHMLFFSPRVFRRGFFCSGQKSWSFDNCWPLWNELNSPMPGIYFTTQKALSLLAAISVCVGSLAGDVKDWMVRGVMVTLWGLCGEASWQSTKLCVIKVDELYFFTRLLPFIFSYFNFFKGKENKNLEEAFMLTGVHLHPEILSLWLLVLGHSFFPPSLISGSVITHTFTWKSLCTHWGRRAIQIFWICDGCFECCEMHWTLFLCIPESPTEQNPVVMVVACHVDV